MTHNKSLAAHSKHNLPAQPTSFIGREPEIAELLALLDKPDCRLLTLVGPGGIGKTRLAIKAAARKIEAFPHGIFFVPLAPLKSAENIVATVISVLGILIGDDGTPREELVKFLSQRHLLLIMDNFEHVLEGADLLSDILQAAPNVKILATSREVLNLREEWVWHVKGMRFPENSEIADVERYSALKLFFDRAQQVRRDFSPQDEHSCAIRTCQLVEGMPLAIELAASWLKTLACTEIGNEIQRSIDFLATNVRNVPERHRSIRAVFDHSWKLCNADEQSVFQKLCVFQGGFEREAAEKVAGASLQTLSGLVEKSMLRKLPAGRYEVHELLRQYAEEKLTAADQMTAIQVVHTQYYADFMRERTPDIKGRRQLDGLNEIEADLENIRVAWERAIKQADYDALDKIMEGLALFCDMRARYQDGDDLFRYAMERLESQDDNVHPTWNRLRVRLAQVLVLPEQNSKAIREQVEPALAVAQALDDHETMALCLWILGESHRIVFMQPERANAIRLYEESLTAQRELGDDFYVGRILRAMAWNYLSMGQDYREAFVTINRQHLDVTRAIGDKTGIAHAIFYDGRLANQTGDFSEAERQYRDAGMIWVEMGDRKSVGVAKDFLGGIYLNRGDFGGARDLAQETLAILSDFNNLHSALFNQSIIAMLEGDYRAAWRLAMEGLALFTQKNARSMPAPWVVAAAAYGLGEYQKARAVLRDFMKYLGENNLVLGRSFALAALLLAQNDEKMWAAEILGLAFTHLIPSLDTWLEKWPLLNKLRADLETELGTEAYHAAWERGTQLNLETTVSHLLDYFGGEQQSDIITANQALIESLTERELEVLALLAKGRSNREIAEVLTVVVGTVKRHVYHISQKLNADNRTQAVLQAKQLGLLR